MQKILIPTDFSAVADNALNYAIEIAAKFKSELYLCHVYSINKKLDYDWDYSDEEQPYKRKMEEKMKLTKLKFTEKIAQKGLSIQTIVEENMILSLFSTQVKKHNIDLIVMGSKGASGLEKVIFGSVAATALEMSKVPVLVVPPEYVFPPFKETVLALDQNSISLRTLSPFQKLVAKFGAKVTLLRVLTDSNKNTPGGKILGFDGVETTYREVPMHNSVNESIKKFVAKENCDLLCLIRREKSFFESIFTKSITKTQVYDSQIPLLVLPENDDLP